MTNFIPTAERVEVSNYPYGRLRCTLYDTIEFAPKKGYRHVTQTINPKTNRINNPKKSTYYPLMVRFYNEDNHIKTLVFSLYSNKEINNVIKFVGANFTLFTKDEIEYIYAIVLTHTKASIQGSVSYGGAKFDELKPLFDPLISKMVEGFKDSTLNNFDIFIDVEAVENCKPKDFNPFVTTKAVSLMSMIK